MKLRSLTALAFAFGLCQCDSGSTPEPGAPDPSGAQTAKSEKGKPMLTLEEGFNPKSIVELLEAKRAEGEPMMLIPCKALGALEAKLKAAGQDFDKPRDFGKSNQYYIHKLVAPLRRQGSVWVVSDAENPALSSDLETYFFAEYKVDYRGRFGQFNIVHAINEIPAAAEARVGLTPVTRIEGMVTNIEFAPSGDTMFLSSKFGKLTWRSMASGAEGVVLRLPSVNKDGEGVFTGGDSGFIGLAVHPGYPEQNKLYLHYSYRYPDGSKEARLAEWEVEVSDAGVRGVKERLLFQLSQVSDNHNGGQLKFGPDGYLYVAVGDGEEGKWSEGRAPAHTLRGKVLRLDVDSRTDGKEYGIPADNPFVGHGTIPPEAWAWGFRNPWRMSFSPDGQLLLGDIGEDRNEEVSLVRRGQHYGWPFYEGLEVRNAWALEGIEPDPPFYAYGRDQGMSVIAGHVYEGSALPWLRGKFVFSDYISGRLWSLDMPEKGAPIRSRDLSEVETLARWPKLLTTFGKDAAGDVYLGAHNGRVFRLGEPVEGQEDEDPSADDMAPSVLRGMFSAELARQDREVAPAEVTLGARLFTDPQLSFNGKQSCASCHRPDEFGQDGKRWKSRNTPTVFNAHRQFAQYWDFRSDSVDDLMKHGHLKTGSGLAKALADDEGYAKAFVAAYPGDTKPTRVKNVGRAIGAYVRQLETRSRWDEFLDGKDDALSAEELRGLNEFVTVGCASCHQYRALGGGMSRKLGMFQPWEGEDVGRAAVTGEESEKFTFKVPALLNIAETGPYYHDGSIKTLEEAVRNMAVLQLNRQVSKQQVDAIVTFLGALTGELPESMR